MNKLAVLGATGMAGHVIAQYMETQGYEVFSTSRSVQLSEKSHPIDATDFKGLATWLDTIQPDHIVNAIGILPKEADIRPDLAGLLNSYLPHALVQKYRNSHTKIIHLSTDCVFSGNAGGYRESDFRDGDSIYDRSKALGEICNGKDLTLRMSIIGPDMDPDGVGLFNWFMRQSGAIKGYAGVRWNGITTIELAKAIQAAIRQGVSGLYHLTPNEFVTKYELLKIFSEEFCKDDVTITPVHDYVVDKTLTNTRTDFRHTIPSYRDMVHEMALWIQNHKGLYHYE